MEGIRSTPTRTTSSVDAKDLPERMVNKGLIALLRVELWSKPLKHLYFCLLGGG
jgi:hypothetical protein